MLRSRFVFVGTELAGLNDEVFSPVHGYLPGVYKHAVAADNLLSHLKDRTDYPTVPRPWLLGTMVVITYLVIETFKECSDGLPDCKWTFRRLTLEARKPAVAAAAVGVLSFLSWVWWIYWWKWPMSLLFAVFGYYLSGVALVEAARVVLGTAEAPAAQEEAK